jgi:glycosyltransferase involved in cell wall biosynthesis
VAKERPTILQIIPHLDAGGAELSTVEIAEALVTAGARALVLTKGGRLASAAEAAGAEVRHFPAATKNPVQMLANVRAIARMVQAEGIDLIHARSRAPAWSALIAARRSNTPFVTTYHGAYRETNALKRFYNGVMARGDVVIANSHYTAALIANRYGTPRRRIEVIHRGVNPRRFDPACIAPERVAALREQWAIGPSERIILQAARLTGWKGQTVLIDAAAILGAAGHLNGISIVLAGDAQGRGDYVERLRRQIDGLGLTQCVHLVGHVEDIGAAYVAAHVTVIASTEPEAFGRTAIEAAAMECPVVATDIGAPPETIRAEPSAAKDEPTGWLVPPGDARALASKLAQALSLTLADRSEMGNRARRHVLSRFTKGAMQRRTLAVYDRLLGTALERNFCERLDEQEATSTGPRQS